MEITIIGLGGIGSVLANSISRYVNTNESVHPVTINLVDGDDYEFKNRVRQEFTHLGNKAEIQYRELRDKFTKIYYKAFPEFITEKNINEIIKENSVVFVCVDNHKSRRLVSNFASTLDNIIVISGGNELTDGNVQIYIRKGGVDVTPSLLDYHPEIENAVDKSPDQLSCEELSNSKPQLYFTNFMVASYMCAAFYNVIEHQNYKYSEIYFDLLTMNASSKVRVPKKNKK